MTKASLTTAELLAKARAAGRPAPQEQPADPRFEQTTIPIPEQPQPRAFRVEAPPVRIELGKVMLCPRCGGRAGKRSRALGYFPDPDGRKDRDGNIRRCIRCNGWGYVPNIGL